MRGLASTPEKEQLRRLKIGCTNRKPLEVVTSQISCKLNEKSYSFVAFVDGYVNQKSRIIANCSQHGNWELSTHKAIFGRGCPKCKVDRLREVFSFTPFIAEKRIREKFKDTSWHFERWKTGYVNQKSKLICRCDFHGEWITSFDSISTQNTGCPTCAKYGFSCNLTGYLYALRSSCGKKRVKGLQNKTPFSFDMIEQIKFENGSTCKELEKMFHDNFESAGFSGFDGATEWLKWTPEIQHWLRLLN